MVSHSPMLIMMTAQQETRTVGLSRLAEWADDTTICIASTASSPSVLEGGFLHS
jgi:hypothetical protein